MLMNGDKRMIYQDPITQQKPEGEATLVCFREGWGDNLELWMVRFDEDKGLFARLIKRETREGGKTHA